MITNKYLLRSAIKQLRLQKQDLLLLVCALVGLVALMGLIYQQGTVPAQAAASVQAADPAKTALSSPLNSIQAQAQITAQNTITPLDMVVVFDISGSMEDQTICHDCWVRTSYNPDWPSNGYFNPIPYDKALADNNPPTGNQSVPLSNLCTIAPPQPFITGTFQYLVAEAELYSAIVGDWGLDVRAPGNGFWSIQRGTRGGSVLGSEESDQGNSAGTVIDQSSNICRPNVQGGQIDCTVGNGNGGLGDDVCADDAGIPNATDIRRDCSAFIAARPIETYGQFPGSIPYLSGAAYNSDCFSGASLSGACWSNNPFNTVPGLETGPSNVPYVEYDFTPTWAGNTYIWIRAIGGGEESYTWAGSSPDQIQPDLNGGGVGNNVTPWRKVIHWQVGNGNITQRKDNVNADYSNSPTENNASNATEHFQRYDEWLVNRAKTGFWRWIRLNPAGTATISGTQTTLKLYQGSAGYLVDKIVFTDDPRGNTPEGGANITNPTGNDIPEALRRDVNGNTVTTGFGGTAAQVSAAWRDSIGPPASWGSATREACNVCNPIYGYTVDPSECTCKKTANDTANGGYGSGLGCTLVTTSTNQLQEQLLTGLYSGLQPIRSAQEAVKKFAKKLDPKFDQLGIVPFTGGAQNDAAQSDNTRRSKLQCLTWATQQFGNPARCYDPSLGTPLTYTNVLSVVEKQWPQFGANTAIGMREGLEELGIGTPGNPAISGACSATVNDGNACDRGGAARRIIILMTDGSPNGNPSNCDGNSGGRPDLWDGLLGTEDADFECAVYYAYLAAQNNVSLYTIGIGSGPDPDLLTAMATGVDPRGDEEDFPMFSGRCGQYFPATKLTDLNSIFDYILAQARSCNPGGPLLEVTKIGTPNPVIAGGILTYTLTVANNLAVNPAFDITGVVITDVLDSNITFVSASDGGVHNADVITWNVGTIPAGQTVTRTLVVTVGNFGGGTLTNTAWVTSSQGISHSTIATTTVMNGEQIWSVSGYAVPQNSNLIVHLENHFYQAGPYDIYLDDGNSNRFKVCDMVNTSPTTHSGDFSCNIGLTPPGFYTLFSTLTGDTNPLAIAPDQVEVTANDPIPPSGAVISGPTTGITNTVYTFTATVSPTTATPPLTYTWQATSQAPIIHTSGLSDTTSFTWTIAGPQAITVTATNDEGAVTDTHIITITPLPCTDPLSEKGFETVPTVKWLGVGTGGVLHVTNSHTGNQALLADTLRPGPNNPVFYQRFAMPPVLISSTTTVKLELFRNVEQETDGPDANDKFYVVLATSPSLSATLTTPVLVSSGDQGALGYDPSKWQQANLILSPASGVNLADYAGQNLYLYFYNNSNQTTPGCPPLNCHNTSFYFDDVNLGICNVDAPVLTLSQLEPLKPVAAGETLTYTIAVANNGSADATDTIIIDTLDSNVSFISASNDGQHSAGVVTWNVGTLPIGQMITRTLAVTVGNVVSGTILSNTVLVTSTEGISYTHIVTTTVFDTSTSPPNPSIYLPLILKN